MKHRAAFVVLVLLAGGGALAFRLPRLTLRPMHCDEAVHAGKFRRLFEENHYRYDPVEYHGPTLNYLTLPAAWLSGAQRYEQIDERVLRIVPVVFGAATVLLLLGLGDGLGRPATVCAAVLIAISPAMVFYSRYYIQETLLVCFTTAALVGVWRYVRGGSVWACVLAGAGFGLMHATKETWPLAAGAMVIAAALGAAWGRWVDRSPRRLHERVRIGPVLLAVGVGAAVSAVFLSSFFTNARGPLDSVLTYAHGLRRAGGGTDVVEGNLHVNPWYFYLNVLGVLRPWALKVGREPLRFVYWGFYQLGRGPIWTEALIVALAGAGAVAALTRKGLGRTDPRLARFLAFYGPVLLAIYSVIPYKTPWCVLGPLHGLILLAGVGAVAVVRWARRLPLQLVAAALIAAAGGQLAWQAYRASFRFYDRNYNPYVYAHSLRGVVRLGHRAEQIAAVTPAGHHMIVRVVAPDKHDVWPIPWYLRSFPYVGYYARAPKAAVTPGGPALDPNTAMWVLAPGAWETFSPTTQAEFMDERNYQIEHYGLRPAVVLVVFIRRDLWERFLAPMRAGREKTMTSTSQPPPSAPAGGPVHRFSERAMGCRFELRIADAPGAAAARAARVAFRELKRIEKDLTRFDPYSDVSQLNVAGLHQPVPIGLDATDCLVLARRIFLETHGAFDVTARPGAGAEGRSPAAAGMDLLAIDPDAHTATRLHEQVRVDLGGIGKGYALDRMAELLREEWDVRSALLHGGASTALAIGAPPGRDGWRLALRDPSDERADALGWVVLRDRALSGSSTVHRGHIVDPRTHRPVARNRAAWAISASAGVADALSTAFCVMEKDGVERYARSRGDVTAVLAVREGGDWRLLEFGRPAISKKLRP